MTVFWLGAVVGLAAVFATVMHILFIFKINLNIRRLRDNADHESAQAFLKDLSGIWWVPNKPGYWTALKESYFIIYHTETIPFEIKRDLYKILSKKRVYGLRKPYKRQPAPARLPS
ncbi:hypothetical protein [Metabacillus sp. RGM 3146]|uniref:hypothetical protein n=1 Tax=Metabacillus sp. RGM 3146 TaxID=3401092 RepID=UPI003B9C46B6